MFVKGSDKMAGQATTKSTGHISRVEKEQRKAANKVLAEYPELNSAAPDWLDDTAKSEWQRVVPLLKKNTPVSELDTSMIASHCALFSTVVNMTKEINKHGEVVETDKGSKQSAYFMARDKAIKEMKAVDSQLGLTPQSRARLELKKALNDEPTDEFEAMLS